MSNPNPEDGEPVTTLSDEEMVAWANANIDRVRELEAELIQVRGLSAFRQDSIDRLEAEVESLREFLERGGIDSSAVLAGEDDGTWQEDSDE